MRESSENSKFVQDNRSLDLYLKEIGRIPMVSPTEEKVLAGKIQAGDDKALNRLVEGNLRFVVSVAKKFCNQRLTLLDLINDGNMGLLEAAKRFDPNKGVKFVTYAVWWIRQSILQSLALHGHVVKLPLKRSNLQHRIKCKEQHLKQKFGRLPSRDELAESLDEGKHNIENVRRATRSCISLEILTVDDEKKYGKLMVQLSQNEDPEEQMMSHIMTETVTDLMDMLTEREAEVIHLHFGLKDNDSRMTLEEIGQKFGMTKEGVRQIEKKATAKLRVYCEATNC